jgi:hypothetical protein
MSDILELLPLPEERNFPAGRFEARRDALVAAVRAAGGDEPLVRRAMRAARGGISRTWLSLVGILAVGLALSTFGPPVQQRPVQRDAVMILAAAGTAQLAIAVAPRAGSADRHR